MKKYIYFLILLFPWYSILSFIFFKYSLNTSILLFIILSSILYIFITNTLYKKIIANSINKDFLFCIYLLYILNQFFNIYVIYYKNYYISCVLGLIQIILLFKIKNT